MGLGMGLKLESGWACGWGLVGACAGTGPETGAV